MSMRPASLCEVSSLKSSLDGHFREVGIGDVAIAQDPGELHRFDFKMAALGALGLKAAEAEMLQDVEGDENGEALAVGRNFQNVMVGEMGRRWV